jgi:hypothetical protein
VGSAAAGVAGWAVENAYAGPRWSAVTGGPEAGVPYLPIYATGGAGVLVAAPHLAALPLPVRFAVYAAGLSALEYAACRAERALGRESWDYGGQCVDAPHALAWGLLGLVAEGAGRLVAQTRAPVAPPRGGAVRSRPRLTPRAPTTRRPRPSRPRSEDGISAAHGLRYPDRVESAITESLKQLGTAGVMALVLLYAVKALWEDNKAHTTGRIAEAKDYAAKMEGVARDSVRTLTEVRATLEATQATLHSLLGPTEDANADVAPAPPTPPPPPARRKQ